MRSMTIPFFAAVALLLATASTVHGSDHEPEIQVGLENPREIQDAADSVSPVTEPEKTIPPVGEEHAFIATSIRDSPNLTESLVPTDRNSLAETVVGQATENVHHIAETTDEEPETTGGSDIIPAATETPVEGTPLLNVDPIISISEGNVNDAEHTGDGKIVHKRSADSTVSLEQTVTSASSTETDQETFEDVSALADATAVTQALEEPEKAVIDSDIYSSPQTSTEPATSAEVHALGNVTAVVNAGEVPSVEEREPALTQVAPKGEVKEEVHPEENSDFDLHLLNPRMRYSYLRNLTQKEPVVKEESAGELEEPVPVVSETSVDMATGDFPSATTAAQRRSPKLYVPSASDVAEAGEEIDHDIFNPEDDTHDQLADEPETFEAYVMPVPKWIQTRSSTIKAEPEVLSQSTPEDQSVTVLASTQDRDEHPHRGTESTSEAPSDVPTHKTVWTIDDDSDVHERDVADDVIDQIRSPEDLAVAYSRASTESPTTSPVVEERKTDSTGPSPVVEERKTDTTGPSNPIQPRPLLPADRFPEDVNVTGPNVPDDEVGSESRVVESASSSDSVAVTTEAPASSTEIAEPMTGLVEESDLDADETSAPPTVGEISQPRPSTVPAAATSVSDGEGEPFSTTPAAVTETPKLNFAYTWHAEGGEEIDDDNDINKPVRDGPYDHVAGEQEKLLPAVMPVPTMQVEPEMTSTTEAITEDHDLKALATTQQPDELQGGIESASESPSDVPIEKTFDDDKTAGMHERDLADVVGSSSAAAKATGHVLPICVAVAFLMKKI